MSNDFVTIPPHNESPFRRGVTHPGQKHMTEAIDSAEELGVPTLETEESVMAIDPIQPTSSPTVEELQRQKEELDRQIAARLKDEKQSVIQQILDVACQYGITIEDLVEAMGGFKPKRKGVKAVAKYRDPISKVTWSGRGKEPTWLKGRDRDEFLIKDE